MKQNFRGQIAGEIHMSGAPEGGGQIAIESHSRNAPAPYPRRETMTKIDEFPQPALGDVSNPRVTRAGTEGGGRGKGESHTDIAPATNIDGHSACEAPSLRAVDPAVSQTNCKHQSAVAGGGADTGGQLSSDTHPPHAPEADEEDRRFADPLVAEIVQMHRQRRRWMKARNALILQGKALCRAHLDSDKTAGTAAFDAAAKGTCDDPILIVALAPFLAAIGSFDPEIRAIERHLEKAAKQLPIWQWAEPIRGLGAASVAAIVGEAGDLSEYRTISGVWKRLGLAVIDGDGRQRRRANADLAALHGYSPERRSIVWNVAEGMSRHQREWRDKETGDITKPAGEFGDVLAKAKARALEKGWTPAHAEAHAKRIMTKEVLKHMTLAWRQIRGRLPLETRSSNALDLPQRIAAE